MKRCFDLIITLAIITLLFLPMLIIAITVISTSKGPVVYWSKRIGKDNKVFKMPKYRTMKVATPEVATHLLNNPENFLSPIGGFLRQYSLDELPQLFLIIKGDMSLVGPRPALFNQDDLISLRNEKDLDKLLPGITGWAQVNGRDGLTIPEKVMLEVEYMNSQSISFDVKILFITFLRVFSKTNISH